MLTAVSTPVDSGGELQGVEERVGDGFELIQQKVLKWLHYHRCQGDWAALINSCGSCVGWQRVAEALKQKKRKEGKKSISCPSQLTWPSVLHTREPWQVSNSWTSYQCAFFFFLCFPWFPFRYSSTRVLPHHRPGNFKVETARKIHIFPPNCCCYSSAWRFEWRLWIICSLLLCGGQQMQSAWTICC